MDWRPKNTRYEWNAREGRAYSVDMDTITKSIFQNTVYWYPSTNYCVYTQRYNEETIAPPTATERPQMQAPPPAPAKTKKNKHQVAHWKGGKNNFTHPFLAANLMGHAGNVLTVDCSSDGKYLVSCAEDDLPPDPGETSSSGSEAGKENRSPPESPAGSAPGSPDAPRRAARRRRKPKSGREGGRGAAASSPTPAPLPRFAEMGITEADLVGLLALYQLSEDQLTALGYPVKGTGRSSTAFVYAVDFTDHRKRLELRAAAAAVAAAAAAAAAECRVSWSREEDSGRGSGSSSPRSPDSDPDSEEERNVNVERRCARCARGFFTTKGGEYVTTDKCRHHWGRLQRVFFPSAFGWDGSSGSPPLFVWKWACCGGDAKDAGCARAPLHVWSGTQAGMNGPLDGFAMTRPRDPARPGRTILALDCEMCYTTRGMQVARLEVVDSSGVRVYDSFVRPEEPIIDYNTRFSGISPEHMEKATKTLRDVQRDLLEIVDAQTILVGHGLENDLKALRLLHGRVVDTAVCFPHERGLPYRQSLRSLAQQHLLKEVQEGGHHCPLEDARVSLDLMLWRVQRDFLPYTLHK